MVYNNYAGKAKDSAPFNMALATLERLSELLKEIKNVSLGFTEGVGYSLPTGETQYAKYKLIKQFFIQAVPLLKEKEEGIIEVEFKKLRPSSRKVNDRYGKYKGEQLVYNEQLEQQLDKLLITIQNFLQADGYFMPPREDPRYAFTK